MDKTRIPLDKWFLLFFMIIQERKNLTIIQIKNELEVSYPTAKLLFEKIKNPEIGEWLYYTCRIIYQQLFPKGVRYKAYRRQHRHGGYFVYTEKIE
ncbi:hypothetical protein AGMMS50268_38600 [Spirochaetia bacterium]|nr:hypothetical protein FACS189491_06680 [Spirochaetia bacterium]GHV88117.1 hypothetical protein AGMMS50267_04770 [Spirochaetia bacterium]GHV93357.1 hypothetical protein AGMMS50268_38600 [Spirochaetia bacterium]